MKKDYEMITVVNYLSAVENNTLSLDEETIKQTVVKYILNMRRNETNEKIVEALLG